MAKYNADESSNHVVGLSGENVTTTTTAVPPVTTTTTVKSTTSTKTTTKKTTTTKKPKALECGKAKFQVSI